MSMLPQPPPDAPAPPPSEHAIRSRRKLLWIFLGIPVLGAMLLCLLAPFLLRPVHGKADMVRATSHAKQIYMLLVDFDQDNGKFPDATTATTMLIKTGNTIPLGGTSSNAHFRQLLAGDYLTNEEVFFAKIRKSRKPDGNTTGSAAIAAGECGFAYVPGFSTASDASTPILVTPLISGTTRFDPKPFKGKAIVLRIDGSTKAETISRDGRVYIDGMDLFDSRQPYWGGKAPAIAYPE